MERMYLTDANTLVRGGLMAARPASPHEDDDCIVLWEPDGYGGTLVRGLWKHPGVATPEVQARLRHRVLTAVTSLGLSAHTNLCYEVEIGR